ncbi:unnamed protein product [Rotaria sp. Silwood1]|nr:unnamed protein product [Rotaria sp. Silwood1]
MSRKYSSWASNQPSINSNLPIMKLATVLGNEQDQLKHLERVEAIPHMYINVDVPPQPLSSSTTNIDTRAMQPSMISRQNSSFFAVPTVLTNGQTKIWPVEKSIKNSSFESTSSTSKRTHKHKHHHHHRGDKHHHHHHHHHHNRRYRAKSAESIRNRPNQTLISPSKMMVTNSQYIEQDQQQQQPMVVYREVPSGESYPVDTTNRLATVPYDTQHETAFVDDQQAPFIVYRDANFQQQQQQQQPQSIVTDGISQQLFFNHDQDAILHQTEPSICLSPLQQQQQQPSQIVYCTDSNQQDYICASNNHNIIQQPISSPFPQQQQQFVCLDNLSTIQPTIINQIPVFNSLPTNTTTPSLFTLPQSQLQRTSNVIIQQPQCQPQPQPFQIIQHPQSLQVIQQPQPIQVIQQPQPLQFIQSPQSQSGQVLQIASATPQIIQTPPVLQTIQIPNPTVAASPQILYQRPYDPAVVSIQGQPMAMTNQPVVALSQPSYAPSRIIPAIQGTQSQAPNMFRHALIRTVAGRTGLPIPSAASDSCGGLQLMQSTVGTPAAANPNLLLANGIEQSASLPIVPLTPDGLLIPFQPSQTPTLLTPGLLPRAGGYPSNLQDFNDIQENIEQQRAQLEKSLRQETLRQRPILSLTSTTPRSQTNPYTSANIFASDTRPSGSSLPPISSTSYVQPSSIGLNYSRPTYTGSTSGSGIKGPSTGPYRPLSP